MNFSTPKVFEGVADIATQHPAFLHPTNNKSNPACKVCALLSLHFLILDMEKFQPYISDALERFNKLSREDKFVGAVGLATLVVLSSYLSKSSKKVGKALSLWCSGGA